MKNVFLIVAALVAGFLGGVLGTRLTRAGEESRTERTVRARSFELMDENGRVVSFWGVDKRKQTVLAFRSRRSVPSEGPEGSPRSPGLDDPLNQGTAIGMIEDSPFLKFRVADGTTRMRLYLTPWHKPILIMEDETGPRVGLGINQSDTPSTDDNDWALRFDPERSSIGMFSRQEGGQKYVRGFFSLSKDKVKYPYVQPK
jgi:hypothetical protein